MHRVPHAARKREPHADDSPRGVFPLSAMPRRSLRSQRAPRPAQFPDARRLHTLPFEHSRLEFRREFPALRRPRMKPLITLILVPIALMAQDNTKPVSIGGFDNSGSVTTGY